MRTPKKRRKAIKIFFFYFSSHREACDLPLLLLRRELLSAYMGFNRTLSQKVIIESRETEREGEIERKDVKICCKKTKKKRKKKKYQRNMTY
jgi:hypothetical protein